MGACVYALRDANWVCIILVLKVFRGLQGGELDCVEGDVSMVGLGNKGLKYRCVCTYMRFEVLVEREDRCSDAFLG